MAVVVCQVATFGLLVGHADLAESAVQALFERAKAGDASCGRTVASIQSHVSARENTQNPSNMANFVCMIYGQMPLNTVVWAWASLFRRVHIRGDTTCS